MIRRIIWISIEVAGVALIAAAIGAIHPMLGMAIVGIYLVAAANTHFGGE